MVGHFHRISQTTSVPTPLESLRDMEFDITRCDSSSDGESELNMQKMNVTILLMMGLAAILTWKLGGERVAKTKLEIPWTMNLKSELFPTHSWQ